MCDCGRAAELRMKASIRSSIRGKDATSSKLRDKEGHKVSWLRQQRVSARQGLWALVV